MANVHTHSLAINNLQQLIRLADEENLFLVRDFP